MKKTYFIYKEGIYRGQEITTHKNTALIRHIITKEGGNITNIIDPSYMAQYTIHPHTETKRKETHTETPYIFKGFIAWQDSELILFN